MKEIHKTHKIPLSFRSQIIPLEAKKLQKLVRAMWGPEFLISIKLFQIV